jgi:hypothetical protein
MMQAKRCRSLEFGYANTEDDRSRVSRVRAKHRRSFVPSIRTASEWASIQSRDRPITGSVLGVKRLYWQLVVLEAEGPRIVRDISIEIRDSSTYGHSQLKTGHPVRSAIQKQLNGRLVLRWVTTWESLLLYVLRILCLFLWFILVDLPCDSLAKSLGRSCVLSGADPGFRSFF